MCQQLVSKLVPTPVRKTGFFRLGLAAADNHVKPLVQKRIDHRGNRHCIVGCVAIYHDVNVRINVCKHAAHHVTLASQPDGDNFGSCGPCRGGRVVAGVVVEHENVQSGHGETKTFDHSADGNLFVKARDDEGYRKSAV